MSKTAAARVTGQPASSRRRRRSPLDEEMANIIILVQPLDPVCPAGSASCRPQLCSSIGSVDEMRCGNQWSAGHLLDTMTAYRAPYIPSPQSCRAAFCQDPSRRRHPIRAAPASATTTRGTDTRLASIYTLPRAGPREHSYHYAHSSKPATTC